MASRLRFDNCVLGTNTIAAAAFVSGSGRITLAGDDGKVTTGAGRIHNFRRTITPKAECELYGDQTVVETAPGLGVTCAFKRGTTTVKSFTAVVSPQYQDNMKTTKVTATGAPSLT